MASARIIAQQIFSHLQKTIAITTPNNNPPSSTDYQCINGTPVRVVPTTNSSLLVHPPNDLSNHLPSLVADFFFSLSSLVVWSELFFYASLLTMFRRFVYYVFGRIYDSFFVTATFEEEDVSYTWMLFWLSQQPSWRKAKDIEISTELFGFESDEIQGEMEDAIHQGSRQVGYLPADDTVHTMWYKNHWMSVTRFTEYRGSSGGRRRLLHLRILARSQTILNDILIDAKKAHQQARNGLISVCVPYHENTGWRMLAARPKRSLTSVILDPGMKNTLIEDAKSFLSSKAWYAARGIPFRRGYLLHGTPGSGKTSLIHSLAGELGLHVYLLPLSKSGMDDTSLSELIARLPEKCIALMEDIDAAFSQTLNRESNTPQSTTTDNDDDDDDVSDDNDKKKPKKPSNKNMITYRPASKITLSGLLNSIDGVGAQEGRLLFATTNKYQSLDPALCRPGRMDIHMEFRDASRYQARELFKSFYMPDDEDLEAIRVCTDEEVVSSKPGVEEDDDEYEKKGEQMDGSDNHPSRMQTLSVDQVFKLAEEFGESIPEREFSMASLQGYLMGHKVTPVAAAKGVAEWVEQTREERQRFSK